MDNEQTDDGAGQLLRRWGPLAAIVVVAVVAVVAFVLPGGDDDDGDDSTDTTAAAADGGADDGETQDSTAGDDQDDVADDESSGSGDDTTPGDGDETTDNEGSGTEVDTSAPFFFSEAEEAGMVDQIDWGDRCDVELGATAYPSPYAMPCIAPFEGDNGGATAKGVTADSIKVVYYLSQEDDPVIEFIQGAVESDDTNAQIEETFLGSLEMFAAFSELYGRTVEVEFYTATGLSNDEVTARADAAAIAEMEPFIVFGSPPFAGKPYAEELAAREVMCLCTGGGTIDFVVERDPYLVSLSPSTQQGRHHLVEFAGKRLQGNAIHSGDFVDDPRRIALVYLETSDFGPAVAQELSDELADGYGIEMVDLVPYAIDPATLQEQAATIIARLKSADVTTIMFAGDPVAPISLTQEATAQSYFPEWVVAGSGLTETTAYGRAYDQEQWRHAFGVTWASVPVVREIGGAYRRYEWFHGEAPPADDTIVTIDGQAAWLHWWVQATGPNLSPRTLVDTLFEIPATESDPITSVRLSWGDEGFWPPELTPDYQGIDDQAEIWWDADTVGLDSLAREGQGVWRWVNDGKRYYPGERPDGPAPFFEEEGSIVRLDELPPDEALPDYPSPAG